MIFRHNFEWNKFNNDSTLGGLFEDSVSSSQVVLALFFTYYLQGDILRKFDYFFQNQCNLTSSDSGATICIKFITLCFGALAIFMAFAWLFFKFKF